MTFIALLRQGFRIARRHPRMVLVAYLAPLLPALGLVALARASLAPVFDLSVFAAQVLDGRWFGAWSDFSASPANHLPVVLGSGLGLAMVITMLVQIVVAAGTVEVLLEREEPRPHPFATGVGLHTWRFLRATLWFLAAGLLAGGVAIGVLVGFTRLAEKASNGRFDLIGIGVAGLLAVLLLAVFVPAFDMTRLAAARHGEGRTLRGFLRAIWVVLRRPGIFLPLFVSYLAVVVALHLAYYAGRSPWTPASATAILFLLLAQQFVMVGRAYLHVSFWGAEIAAYRMLGEPRLCEPRPRRRPVAEVVEPQVIADVPDADDTHPDLEPAR